MLAKLETSYHKLSTLIRIACLTFFLLGIQTVFTNAYAGWSDISPAGYSGENFQDIYFINNNTGFVVGSNSTILRTDDGGASWTPASSTPTTNTLLYSVHFPVNDQVGYVAGENGNVWKTTDGGDTWTADNPPGSPIYNDVFFIDNSTGYVVGSNAIAYGGTNCDPGPCTWTDVTSGGLNAFQAIYFTSATTGYKVGNTNTVRYTNNSGSSWETQTPPTGTPHVNEVIFPVDISTGYIVSNSGRISKTTNGGTGATWSTLTSGVSVDLKGISFPGTNTTGYVAGFSGTILKTEDSGATWESQFTGTSNNLLSIHFPIDSTTGYASGVSGTVLKTSDSGGDVFYMHPTANASNQFAAVGSCSTQYQCINDQTTPSADAATGTPETNNTNDYVQSDTNGHVDLYDLVDDAVPAGSIITGFTITAQFGRGNGSAPTLNLLYQRQGIDLSPVAGPDITTVATTCCTTQATFSVNNINWSRNELNKLRIGFQRVSGGGYFVYASQLYVQVAYTAGNGSESTISGKVFNDANFDGTATAFGAGDSQLGGVDVELYRVGGSDVYFASTTTDGSGNYSFSNVEDGTYKVRVRSASIGGSNPAPEMTWGNGAAMYGGQNASVDDTATGDNAGPGDTYVTVVVSSADVTGVDFGFAYNLISNTNTSGQGSLDQFIDIANTSGLLGASNTDAQFRIETAANRSNGGDSWHGIEFTQGTASMSQITGIADGITIDGSTQTTNVGDTNSNGPEIEIYCSDCTGTGSPAYGIDLNADSVTLANLTISGFNSAGIRLMGGTNKIYSNYIGTNGVGTAAASPSNTVGILMENFAANYSEIGNYVVSGDTVTSGLGNVISGNGIGIVDRNTSWIKIRGNLIGTNAAGTGSIGNTTYGIELRIDQASAQGIIIGGNHADKANVIAGGTDGIVLSNNLIGGDIQGNYIGTDSTGALDLGGSGSGILANSTSGTPVFKIGGLNADEGNTIANYGGVGINYTMSNAGSHLIQGNSIKATGGHGIVVTTAGVRIEKNIIYDLTGSAQDGISVSAAGQAIYHNTIHNVAGDGIDVQSGATSSVVRNNIVSSATGADVVNGAGLADTSITYNDFFSNGSTICSVSCDSSNTANDPLFYNAGAGNFTLNCSSLTIDAGLNIDSLGNGEVQTDLNGADTGKYYDTLPDQGAEESNCGATYTISGVVFNDADFAGTASTYDGGTNDAAASGVDVELYDNSNVYQISTTTAGDGSYSFSGLVDGTYKIRVRSATVSGASPVPELAWANGAAMYGGQDPTVADTATGDNAGIGDTYVAVAVSGGNVSNVDFGFAYNLIVNTADSGQGSLRQFMLNAANGGLGANNSSSQFRMQVPTNQNSGGDNWWRISPVTELPTLSSIANDTVLDASTQRTNSASDDNSRGPEIEINGASCSSCDGIVLSSATGVTIHEFAINGFANGIDIGASASNAVVTGNYIGVDATGTLGTGNTGHGVNVQADNATIGGNTAALRNVLSANSQSGIQSSNTTAIANITIQGNYIGTNATGTAGLGNGIRGITLQSAAASSTVLVGGTGAGEGNLVGYTTNTGGSGIYLDVDGGTHEVSGNTIRNSNGIGLYILGATNLDVHKNIIHDNGDGGGSDHGIYVWQGSNINFVNNTIYNSDNDGINIVNGSSFTIHNNIFSNNGNNAIQDSVPAITAISNNNYFGNAGNCSGANCGSETNSITTDPAFVNATSGDFSLTQCTSGAINTGVDLGGSQPDLNGATVGNFNGNAPDMGAEESSCVSSIIVTNNNDSGAGSLRQAMLDATAGQSISFDAGAFPTGTPSTITLASNLPSMGAGSITIDASNAGVIVDGASTYTCIVINSNSNVVKGLRVQNCAVHGVYIQTGTGNTIGGDNTTGSGPSGEGNVIVSNGSGGIQIESDSNLVYGNYIGIDIDSSNGANGSTNVMIFNADSNTIGATGAGYRNILAYSPSRGLRIQHGIGNAAVNNYIGTNVAGTSGAPNLHGVLIDGTSTGNTIGGTGAGEGNVISGNNVNGIVMQDVGVSANNIYGNYIGVQSDGVTALGNAQHNINISTSASSNVIGGTGAGEANIIANAGTGSGVEITSGTDNVISGNQIYANATNGITLQSGANNDKAAPTITNITVNGSDFDIVATVTSGDTIEFFRANNTASPTVTPDSSGEGYLFLGSCVDNGVCSGPHINAVADADATAGTVQATLLSSGVVTDDSISATATDGTNGTSQFATNYNAAPTSINVSGTCKQLDQTADCTDTGTIRVAVNGALQAQTQETVAGSWTVSGVSQPSANDIVTVYIEGAPDANEAVAIAKYDGTGNITGIELIEQHLTIGSDDNQTLTNANLSQYDNSVSASEDVFHDVDASNNLEVDTTGNITNAELYIKAGNTFQPDSGGGKTITSVDVEINGTFTADSNAISLTGSWDNNSAFNAGTSTVNFIATTGTELIDSTGATTADFYNITFNDSVGSATYQLESALSVGNDLTLTDGILDTKNGSNFAINVSNDFSQPGTAGLLQARSSTITVGNNVTFNGTESSTSINNASLVMTGAGTLAYNNLASPWFNGVNDLTVGQSGNTTNFAGSIAIGGVLTIGSGTLNGFSNVYLLGAPNPLAFDVNSTLSISNLFFFSASPQNIIPLANGYDTNIGLAIDGANVTQTGNITLNAGKNLEIDGGGFANRQSTYSTAGFDLTVGGNLLVGFGNDTKLKTFDATNSTITVSGDFNVVDVGGGTTQAVFTSTGSTVTLNGAAAQNVTVSGSSFNNLTITNASVAGVTFNDAFAVNDLTNATAGSTMTFTSGATYTINGDLKLSGDSGNLITITSTGAGQHTLNVTNGQQIVFYVDVDKSNADSNDIQAINSIDQGTNDTGSGTPEWVFTGAVVIDQPTDNVPPNPGELRHALENLTNGDTIVFDTTDFPTDNPVTITLTAGLDLSGADNIIISGEDAGVIINGNGVIATCLTISSSNNVVRGLRIENCTENGILIASGTNNTIGGNRNTGGGISGQGNILVTNGSGGTGNGLRINSNNNFAYGNLIGTAGATDLGNGQNGIYLAGDSNTVGSTSTGMDNIISGNDVNGVLIDGDSNTVVNNVIGLNLNSNGILANTTAGIAIAATASGNTIGGLASGAGNLIAGNGGDGVIQSITTNSNNVYGNTFGGTYVNGGDAIEVTSGTLVVGNTSETDSNIIDANTGFGIHINGGLLSLGGSVDLNDDFRLTSGSVNMGASTVNLAGNWIHVAGTVTEGTSTLILDGSTPQDVGTGVGNDFYNVDIQNSPNLVRFFDGFAANNFSATLASTNLQFKAGAIYTINGNLNLNGQAASTEVILTSDSAGTRFTFDVTSADQTVQYVDVKDSEASSNNILAFNSVNNGGNDDAEANPRWQFVSSGLLVTTTANSGSGSLLAALTAASASDTIYFDTSVFALSAADNDVTISPTDATTLAMSTGSVTIDASNVKAIIDGASLTTAPCIEITTSNNKVRGLQIQNCPQDGILISAGTGNTIGGDNTAGGGPSGEGNVIVSNGRNGIQVDTGPNAVFGNYIGTDTASGGSLGNAVSGINVNGASVTIGGTGTGQRNILSGNGYGLNLGGGNATVQSNYIGTNVGGAAAVANTLYGVYFNSTGNTLGGSGPGEGNVISGNTLYGIVFNESGADSNNIYGNNIGTNFDASAAVANNGGGVYVGNNVTGNNIGGTAAGQGNVISGNGGDGINFLSFSTNNSVLGNYIGTNASSTAIPNTGDGIEVGTSGTVNIGDTSETQSNIIAANGGNGINQTSGTISLGGTVDVDDTVNLSGGVFAMNDATLNVAGGFNRSGSVTFNANTSTIVFDGSATQNINSNGATYNNITVTNASNPVIFQNRFITTNFTAITAGTTLQFAPLTVFDITGTLNINGQAPGTEITLNSTNDTDRFTFDVSADQNVYYVNVSNAAADTSDIYAFNSTSVKNNDDVESAPFWVFVNNLEIVKKAYLADGTPLSSGTIVPKGTVVKYLLYINNYQASSENDVSVLDVLDPAFAYQAGTLKVDNSIDKCASVSCTLAEEAAIFAAVDGASAVTDAVDGDVASYTAGSTTVEAGNRVQSNAQLNILANKVWAILISVKMQ